VLVRTDACHLSPNEQGTGDFPATKEENGEKAVTTMPTKLRSVPDSARTALQKREKRGKKR